jgi:hypothetical protein
MVKIINTGLPQEFNNKIITELAGSHLWRIAIDDSRGALDITKKGKKDTGFSFTTFRENEINQNSSFWNSLAEIIFYIVCAKADIKNATLFRIMYNFYTPSAECNLHLDMPEDNYFSILYNFHDNDGGTFFKKENKTYPSKASQALLFKSNLIHKGVAPKKYLGRLNLNMICKLGQ